MNKKELKRYLNGIKDLLQGYGVIDFLAAAGLVASGYLFTLITYAFM